MSNIEQLKDIQGLKEISIWPFAYGWWIIIIVIIVVISVIIFLLYKKTKLENNWKFKARYELKILKENIDKENSVSNSFELLKKISIMKFGRSKCAHLTGNDWLKWLSKNDKNKFNWYNNCKSLIKLQYAPNQQITEETKDILQKMHIAIFNLIKK